MRTLLVKVCDGMLYKKRGKSYKLQVMELLQYRIELSSEGRRELSNQESGYTGECGLDTFTGELTCECLVLNDLPLVLSGTDFQIDALIITPHEIGLYEVKNYAGEYLHNDGFFEGVHSDFSFHSPIERVNRHTSLLRSLLKKHHFTMPIKQYVVFIHPEFMLYDASLYKKVLLHATLPGHFRKLNKCSGELSNMHMQLAKKLCDISEQTEPYTKGIPKYTFEECKKGVVCEKCGCFILEIQFKNKVCTCLECGHQELVTKALSRHIREYHLLFPLRRMNISGIYEWCGGVFSERKIRAALQKEYQAVSAGKYRHYV